MKKVAHKYALEVMKNVTRAYEIYKRNNDTLWPDAIKEERKNFILSFDLKEKYTRIAPGHSYLDFHLIFDIKMDFN